ncbi:MAG TPA: hypothetical protein VNW97_10950, partial [Candidatus Saccharimonadales bacterium]|nr:hypothetical protein [Candidatus Saccharimonadales bacterium]
LSKVTITGNTATGDGGGIHVDSATAASGNHLTISFSRLANNSGATGANLGNVGGAITATNNWWGSNAPAGSINDPASTATFDPFIVLTHTASPNPLGVNRTSTLTANMGADNHGVSTALNGNLDVFSGLPVTFGNPVMGTIGQAPGALHASAPATATFKAGPSAGTGSAAVTVDQQTVIVPITLVTATPPVISKLFLPDTVTVNGTTLLSFTISNPNSDPNPNVTLTGLQFTDSLPAGVVVASPNQLSNDCGGTVTADPGSASISLSGGSLGPAVQLRPQLKGAVGRLQLVASGSCFISVEVRATTTGVKSNITGPISANESGAGAPSNTATLTVIPAPVAVPPTVSKAFGDALIAVGGSTSLTFNFANPNSSTTLTDLSLNDPLPAGLVVANPNGFASTCDGVFSTVSGSSTIAMTSASLGPNASCSLSVNVTSTSGGSKVNTTNPVTAMFDDGTGHFQSITGGSATASIVVVLPPVIAKAFIPAIVAPNGVSTLSFTIANPPSNPVPEAGVAFSDSLPANVFVATPNGATGNCNGGTLTAAAGSNSISLTGGTIPVGGFCVVSVNVTSAVTGSYTNTTGPVSSTNGGTGNTATAILTVKRASLIITKTHAGNFNRRATGVYTITVSDDPGAGPTIGAVNVTDILPDVTHTLVATDISGPGWICNLGSLTCTRSDALAPGASYPPITLTVNVPQNITANVINTATVSGGGDLNSHTAQDPTHIDGPEKIDKVQPNGKG